MIRPYILLSSLALTFALGTITSPAEAAHPTCGNSFAITNVRVFDGDKVIAKTTVLVVDDEIAAVGPKVKIPQGTPTIDGTGATLIPGLLDSHAHAWQRADLERAAQFGVTTEFDMCPTSPSSRR